ncbi:MAG: hypothetical protein Q8R02_21025 [Hyphomonadaceae bacterium]|nr:hypothetical protein [Hyphomonadaceae bacterium]
MKAFVPIAASLVLALAPSAYAQVTCSEVNQLNAYGLDDFDAIVGDEIDDDFYKATYALNGALECSIDYGFDSIYTCTWTFSTYAEAAAAWNAQIGAVGSCLPGWPARPETPSSEASGGYRALQTTYFAGSGTYEDMEWGVFLEEHTFDGGSDWHVGVGLAWLL